MSEKIKKKENDHLAENQRCWSEVIEVLENVKLITPSSENTLKIDSLSYMIRMQDLVARNGQAHQLMHGMLGRRADLHKAFEIFQETSAKGNPEGIYNAGLFYSRGYGVRFYNNKNLITKLYSLNF